MTFDTEIFIMEIEKRPPLWDMSLEAYTNVELKKELWEELADIFGGEEMKPRERKELGIGLQKKWKNIRDCFTRELRRLKGDACRRKSQYTYFDQLHFLKSTVVDRLNEIDESATQQEADGAQSSEDAAGNRHTQMGHVRFKRRRDEDPIDKELLEVLNKGFKKKEESDIVQADEDRMFLLSLLSDLKQVPEHLKLKTKIDLMVVLDNAKKGSVRYEYGAPSYLQDPAE